MCGRCAGPSRGCPFRRAARVDRRGRTDEHGRDRGARRPRHRHRALFPPPAADASDGTSSVPLRGGPIQAEAIPRWEDALGRALHVARDSTINGGGPGRGAVAASAFSLFNGQFLVGAPFAVGLSRTLGPQTQNPRSRFLVSRPFPAPRPSPRGTHIPPPRVHAPQRRPCAASVQRRPCAASVPCPKMMKKTTNAKMTLDSHQVASSDQEREIQTGVAYAFTGEEQARERPPGWALAITGPHLNGGHAVPSVFLFFHPALFPSSPPASCPPAPVAQ